MTANYKTLKYNIPSERVGFMYSLPKQTLLSVSLISSNSSVVNREKKYIVIHENIMHISFKQANFVLYKLSAA